MKAALLASSRAPSRSSTASLALARRCSARARIWGGRLSRLFDAASGSTTTFVVVSADSGPSGSAPSPSSAVVTTLTPSCRTSLQAAMHSSGRPSFSRHKASCSRHVALSNDTDSSASESAICCTSIASSRSVAAAWNAAAASERFPASCSSFPSARRSDALYWRSPIISDRSSDDSDSSLESGADALWSSSSVDWLSCSSDSVATGSAASLFVTDSSDISVVPSSSDDDSSSWAVS